MLKARLHAASAITDDLLPAETSIEEAFQRVALLLNTMCAARVAANLPIQTARREFDHISSALQHISQARSHILGAHDAFVETRAAVLPTVSWGDNGACPPSTAAIAPGNSGAGSTHLHVVG